MSGQTNITGHGVTLFIADGSVSMSGGGAIDLSAPTSGAWQGILFFQDRENTSSANLTGGSEATMKGDLYFPKATLSLAGGSEGHMLSATIVASKLNMVGHVYAVNTKYTAGAAGVHLIE